MKRLNEIVIRAYVNGASAMKEFATSERGDTNFVSMLLIIGIVVVLAGLFLTLGKGVMEQITDKVDTFISSLG